MPTPIDIHWSREASVYLGGLVYNAFQRHSYVARVEQGDRTFILVLPKGAARWTTLEWHMKIEEIARWGLSKNVQWYVMGDNVVPKQSPWERMVKEYAEELERHQAKVEEIRQAYRDATAS